MLFTVPFFKSSNMKAIRKIKNFSWQATANFKQFVLNVKICQLIFISIAIKEDTWQNQQLNAEGFRVGAKRFAQKLYVHNSTFWIELGRNVSRTFLSFIFAKLWRKYMHNLAKTQTVPLLSQNYLSSPSLVGKEEVVRVIYSDSHAHILQ